MYYFIVNPNSRSGKGTYSSGTNLHQQLMLRQNFLSSTVLHDIPDMPQRLPLMALWSWYCIRAQFTLIAVGGDGTIHEVLTGITDFDRVIFGYIPTGSGNDFCRSMELPFDPMRMPLIIF